MQTRTTFTFPIFAFLFTIISWLTLTETEANIRDKITSQRWYQRCSQQLGISISASENRLLYTRLSEWYGTPYQFGNNEIQIGTDCSGFVSKIYAEVYALSLPRTSQAMYDYIQKVPYSDLQTGDLVFFRTGKTFRITHVGIYLKEGKFIHASSFHGVTISNLNKTYYRQRLVGVGRHQQMQNSTSMSYHFQKLSPKKAGLIISQKKSNDSLPISQEMISSRFKYFLENRRIHTERFY